MWLNKYIKLSIVLYLTMLVTLTRGQDIVETTDALTAQDFVDDVREETIKAENLYMESNLVKDQTTDSEKSATNELANGELSNADNNSETNVDSPTETETGIESSTNPLDSGNIDESNVDSATESEINSESVTETEINSESVTATETTINVASVSNEESSTEAVTNQIDCICDCTSNGGQVTLECSTQSPQETQTENAHNSQEETSSNTDFNNDNQETTNPTVAQNSEHDTSSNTDDLETTNPSISENDEYSDTTTKDNIKDDTTTTPETNENPETSESNIVTETTTPPPSCSTPGVQPHVSDCQQYYDCSSEGSIDGSFHLLTKSCPDKQAFNIELNRCSRDLSSCSNPINCLNKAGVADPASNNSYYLCEPRLIGEGFRIFHIDCSSNELFYPELGKCFVDINNLPSQIYPPYYNWNQLQDIDIVKAELKLLKEQDKLKLKQEKDRIKAEEKLQKQIEKEAKKRAKEEEKLNKEKAKQEAASFVCAEEGNFRSPVGDDTYFACISKKGKLKALVMQCPIGSKFNAESGTCVNSPLNNNGNDTDDDDDDDNEDDD